MENLKTAIYHFEQLSKIKELLHQCHRDDLEGQKLEGFDILQHAILAHNLEVIQLLFLKGNYLRQFSDEPRPYLHLACLCGNSAIATTILEFRPNDFQKRIENTLDWMRLESILVNGIYGQEPVSSSEKFAHIREAIDGSTDTVFSPLDIAALAGHVKCVRSLLSSNASGCSLNSLFERAIEVHSPCSLKLLLNEDSPKQQEVNSAFCSALRRKQRDCLEICLDYPHVDVYGVLNSLNPYHVLYMYSSAYQVYGSKERNKGMASCTQTLIDHVIDLNTKDPIGSFPLYSLIAALVHEKDTFPNKVPVHHIRSLDRLLNGGADPNFDEVLFSQAESMHELSLPTIGRDLFASSLNAFFVSLQASDTWRPHLAEHLDVCCLMLLERGANPTYLNPYGDTPLHDLMKVMAMQHAMGHMHADLGTMCRMLLYFGADPNQMSTNGMYPVHYYFPILVNLMGGKIAFTRWLDAENLQQVLQLLYYMDIESSADAYKQIITCLVNAKRDGVPERALDVLHSYAKALIFTPKPLQELCKMLIWKSVERKDARLKALHIPKRLIQAIKDIFMLDID